MKKKCFIIGETTLALQCIRVLLKNNYMVEGLLTDNLGVANQVKQQGIPSYNSKEKFFEILLATDYDYLFSIVNYEIIPKRILDSANVACINFHDSLLPDYPGRNAPSWAILNGEQKHGITWHIMVEKVDAGPILMQEEFTIADDDTALTLNLKCYQYAVTGFAKLIDLLDEQLISDSLKHIKDVKLEYYYKNSKPRHGCIVDWNCSASEIYRVFRACYFGSYKNTFIPVKCMVASSYVQIEEMNIKSTQSQDIPGTCIVDNNLNKVYSTADYDVEIIIRDATAI